MGLGIRDCKYNSFHATAFFCSWFSIKSIIIIDGIKEIGSIKSGLWNASSTIIQKLKTVLAPYMNPIPGVCFISSPLPG